ncbi:MAG: GGDEF domain-containing protein [Ectothiorhodospiraceae bacterium]|jgi:diguanylate cyclase (GGDEF)-like protein
MTETNRDHTSGSDALREALNLVAQALEHVTTEAVGVDDGLRAEIERLRASLARRPESGDVDRRVDAITDLVVSLAQRVSAARVAARRPLRELLGVLQSRDMPATLRRQSKNLASRLPAKDDAELQRLWTEAISAAQNALRETRSPGLLGRLRRRGSDDATRQPAANQQPVPPEARTALVTLLDTLCGSDSVAHAASSLRERLCGPMPIIELAGAVDELVELVTRASREENEALERFLEQVSERLGELETFLEDTGELSDGAKADRQAMDASVRSHVRGLRVSAGEASSVDQLRELINDHMDAILLQLDSYMLSQERRRREAETRADSLSERLKESEQETATLQQSLIQQRMRAQIDTLTQVANREAYNQRLEHEYARWRRRHTPLSLAFADVDRFKYINDRFGHNVGDRVLQALAHTLKSNLRPSDLIARYGGEEFVILMPETDTTGARVVAERLRRALEGQPFHAGEERIPITVSFGVTEFRPGDTPEDALKRADHALYDAKRAGRNQVKVASEETDEATQG